MNHRPPVFSVAVALLLAAGSSARANPPAPADTLRDMVTQTACVAEGDVTNVSTTYDAWAGPRTVVTLSNVVARFGVCPSGTITIKQVGGPLPSGRTLVAPALPRFFRNAHYVVFLRNTDWHLSPVLFQHAYRAETVAGKSVLIDQTGSALLRIDQSGLVPGGPQLFQPSDPKGDQFSRPPAVAGITADQIPITMSADVLVQRLSSFTAAEGVYFGGSVNPEPALTHAWNAIPGKPRPSGGGGGGGGGCTNPLGCLK